MKRVMQGNDKGLVEEIFRPNATASQVCICLCEDGRGGDTCAPTIARHLRTLYAHWGHAVTIAIEQFSFFGDVMQAHAMLSRADVFWFAGIFEVPGGLRDRMAHTALLSTLQARVQYNHCAFVGICGGAVLSGAHNSYGLPPLDLLDGVRVHYDANVSAKAVPLRTSSDNQLVQMTSGCALAIVVWGSRIASQCFPVVKNQFQWWDFSTENSRALQRLTEKKAEDWAGYEWPALNDSVEPVTVWYFNLRGFVWMRGSMQNIAEVA